MWKFLGVLFVIVVVWLGFKSSDTPTAPQPKPATAEERAEAVKQQRELEAQDAARKALRETKFKAERASIISKAKALLVQHKWQQLHDMGSDYAWASDSELNAMTEAARSKLADSAMAKARVERRKQGVSIGMSKQDVLNSSWGRPNKVNTTTTVHGTREQWVYGEYGQRGFLYFDGDTLTTIQN